MAPNPTPAQDGTLQPILVSVKEAARVLGISPWSAYQLCDEGKLQAVYHGRRRLVRVDSIHGYVNTLSTYPEKSA